LAVASASVVGSSVCGDSWVVADLQVVVASSADVDLRTVRRAASTAAEVSTVGAEASAAAAVAAASMAEVAVSTAAVVADTGNLCRR